MNKFNILILLAVFTFGNTLHAKVKYFKASSGEGYHFPFYLYIPAGLHENDSCTLIVEPNNSGFVSDKLREHRKKAKRTVQSNYYLGRYVAEELQYPLLVPVFPRLETDWKIYTHSLDRDAILIEEGKLKRLDEQLIAMTKSAAAYMEKKGINLRDEILLTGFSASGTFVNRFTFIHPDKVKAAAAGGLNGLLILPMDELDGELLIYPVGMADYNSLFGKPFDREGFLKTPQYLFMGEMDENDAIPYADGYDEEERQIIYRVLGKEMQPGRWNSCVKIYKDEGVSATMKVYKGIGHEHPDVIKQEVLDFFKKVLNQD